MASTRAPTWLSKQAKTYWKKLHQRCDSDEMLAVFCTAISQFRSATEQINKEGFLIPTTTGGMKQNPACHVQKESFNQLNRLKSIINDVDDDETDDLSEIFG